jgi:hypothetical protein
MWKRRVGKKKIPCMWKKKEPQRPERPETLKERFLSKLRFASFYASAVLFFFFVAFFAFLVGLLQPQNTLALLTFLLSLLPPVLTLTSSTLLKALEDKSAQKRLAASVLFVAISFPGSWLAGMILNSLIFQDSFQDSFQEFLEKICLVFQGKSLCEWILGFREWILGFLKFIIALFYIFYILFLVFPYRASASHLVGILLVAAREGGLIEDTTQATPQEKA